MELQLGLALPIHSPMVKGLDLNCLRFESDVVACAGEDYWDQSKCGRAKNKRGFEEAFGKIGERCSSPQPRKLVADMLVWHGQPNEGGDDGEGHKKKDSCPINK